MQDETHTMLLSSGAAAGSTHGKDRSGFISIIMQHDVLLQPVTADDNQPWLTDACGVTPDTCGVSLDIRGVALDTCAVALDTCIVALDTYGVDLMPAVWPETVAYCPCLHQL